jgi:hypothetical protein
MEAVRTFLSSPVATALIIIAAVIVGFFLREWAYRNRGGYSNGTLDADFRINDKKRKRNRKNFAKMGKNGSNEINGSKVVKN